MAAEFEAEVNLEQIEKLVKQGTDAVQAAIRLVAIDLWGNIRAESPVDHGRLAGSFEIEGDGLEWRIFTNVQYALFVQEGTGVFGPFGQPIVPVSSPVLVFEINGQTVFARSVQGQEANPYVDRAIHTVESKMDQYIDMALREVGV